MKQYITVAKGIYEPHDWFILDDEINANDCPFKTKKIHIKHKDILDAYLQNNNVHIYWKVNLNADISHCRKPFIDEYNENYIYKIDDLTVKPKNNFKDYGFEADFEGHIYERDRTYLLGKVRLDCDIKLFRWNYQTGICREDEKYNLKPIKKEWYEKEDTFVIAV